MVTSEDKTMALLAHLLSLFVGFIAPLIIWLMKKDQSEYVAQHAKEALNFQISMTIYLIVASFLIVLLVGLVLLPILGILDLVFIIIATIKASNGEFYQYPMTIRLIK